LVDRFKKKNNRTTKGNKASWLAWREPFQSRDDVDKKEREREDKSSARTNGDNLRRGLLLGKTRIGKARNGKKNDRGKREREKERKRKGGVCM